jgi:hypothetical protein
VAVTVVAAAAALEPVTEQLLPLQSHTLSRWHVAAGEEGLEQL